MIHYACFVLSIFILFLDLEQAFDKVIREVMMGWPQCDDGRFDTSKQRIDYLISLGLDPEVASFISFTSKNMAQLVRVLALMNASLNGLRVFTRLLGSRLETLRHT
jgi:hypothetical protein